MLNNQKQEQYSQKINDNILSEHINGINCDEEDQKNIIKSLSKNIIVSCTDIWTRFTVAAESSESTTDLIFKIFKRVLRPLYRFKTINKLRLFAKLYLSKLSAKKLKKPLFSRSILLVTHDCHPYGAQLIILNIGKILVKMKYNVSILALGNGGLSADFEKLGTTFITNSNDLESASLFLRKLREDGVYCAMVNSVASGSVLPLLKQLGFNVISLVHELPGIIQKLNLTDSGEAIARLSDKIVFPANIVMQRFCDLYNMPLEQNRLIVRSQALYRKNSYKNNSEKAYKFVAAKHKIPEGNKIVLGVGYVGHRKGSDLFVEIAKKTIDDIPNCIFIWLGGCNNDWSIRINEKLKKYNLKDRVLFLGYVQDPSVYFAAASVLALTSREDPYPSVVLEATDVGVPVVAFNNTTGSSELIIEQGGRLVDDFNTDIFARQIGELVTQPIIKKKNNSDSYQKYVLDLLYYIKGLPRISVVVPNYNYDKYILNRLNNVSSQKYPIYELIILDDCSSDNSLKEIDKFISNFDNKCELITNDKNSGSVFYQWCQGIKRCTGDLVWIAEADDLADPMFLEKMTLPFKNQNVVLTYSQSIQIDENGSQICVGYSDNPQNVPDTWSRSYCCDGIEDIRSALTIKNSIPNASAVLFRRKALEKALLEIGDQLFEYQIVGDWVVYLYVLTQGKIYYNKEPLNYNRRHSKSVSNTINPKAHLSEIQQAQNIAFKISDPPLDVSQKALLYVNNLQKLFSL